MIFSMHIPKTAGTSFYKNLELNYTNISPSLKRRDIIEIRHKNALLDQLMRRDVVHGHMTYNEAIDLLGVKSERIIFWVRNPVQRVISNYSFFIQGLHNPSRNKQNYLINRHRINESLLEYAEKEENRNRISKFLGNMDWSRCLFIGRVENFEEDIMELSKSLGWEHVDQTPHNQSSQEKRQIGEDELKQIEALNERDMDLYYQILEFKRRNGN